MSGFNALKFFMKNKPISPLAHGLIDYGFVATQLVLPPLLGVNKKAVKLFRFLGVNLGTYNALTAHGAAIKPLIPFQTHYKIDYGNVAGLALLTLHKSIRKDKKALLFHSLFVALAAANVLLTDWKESSTQPAT